jgi:hypothetical protein
MLTSIYARISQMTGRATRLLQLERQANLLRRTSSSGKQEFLVRLFFTLGTPLVHSIISQLSRDLLAIAKSAVHTVA